MKRIVLTATALLAFTGTAAASSLYIADPAPSFVSHGRNSAPETFAAANLGMLDVSFNARQSGSHIATLGLGDVFSGTAPSFQTLGNSVTHQLAAIKGETYSFDYILGTNESLNGDTDFDDFVVGVNFKPSVVPLPAAAWLFGSALFGFVMVSNRRKV